MNNRKNWFVKFSDEDLSKIQSKVNQSITYGEIISVYTDGPLGTRVPIAQAFSDYMHDMFAMKKQYEETKSVEGYNFQSPHQIMNTDDIYDIATCFLQEKDNEIIFRWTKDHES